MSVCIIDGIRLGTRCVAQWKCTFLYRYFNGRTNLLCCQRNGGTHFLHQSIAMYLYMTCRGKLKLALDYGTSGFNETLQWRNNEHYGVPDHQVHGCLLNRLFRRRSKKTPTLHVTGYGAGNSPVTDEFPTKRASNTEIVSIWWRHHEVTLPQSYISIIFGSDR